MSESSALGTVEAAGRDWAWTIDEVEGWTAVPSSADPAEVVREWHDEVVAAVLASVEPTMDQMIDLGVPVSDADRELMHRNVAESVTNLVAFADQVAPDARVAALVGLQDRGPVPVLVSVALSEPGAEDDTLMQVLGATGGNPVNPPNIEYLDLPDGDGVRVTRMELDPDNAEVWLSVGLGRRTEHADAVVDTVLLWRTQDIIIAEAVGAALDELLPAVRITRGEQARSEQTRSGT
ncbi:hypothetical protein ACH47X_09150 [Promicromonospora kroppenstedtii]|uniref:Uncharacterized protein n=1 Tax=Promicromonospora kroppenstedtii TaxID=440482 RepID=A0ABW7XHR0_9MICO